MAADPRWQLTRSAFEALLGALDPDRDAAAAHYLEVRRNLVRLFEWRGCHNPEDLADETLNRCARKLQEGHQIRDVATYAIGVGRMVLRESGRAKESHSLDQAPEPRTMPPETDADSDRRAECLGRCLEQLPSQHRDLILHYYQGEKGEKIRNRKSLTELLGIPAGLLRMRALRLREKLQACMELCLGRK